MSEAVVLNTLSTNNRILQALPEVELEPIRDALVRVQLVPRDILYDVGQPIEHVYFPETLVCSTLGVSSEGHAVEAATIGNEGFVGLPLFLGGDRSPNQAICQVPGYALRMPAANFLEVARKGELDSQLRRYTLAMLTLLSQSSACNRLHLVQERCARWLLMTHDRVASNSFSLAQDFLSQMLGVRRTSVSLIAARLQDIGLITYTKGIVTITDRPGLEQVSCECYAIIRRDFDRLLGRHWKGQTPASPLQAGVSDGDKSTVRDGTPREADDDDFVT